MINEKEISWRCIKYKGMRLLSRNKKPLAEYSITTLGQPTSTLFYDLMSLIIFSEST